MDPVTFYWDMFCCTGKEVYLTLYNEAARAANPSHQDVTIESLEADKKAFGF